MWESPGLMAFPRAMLLRNSGGLRQDDQRPGTPNVRSLPNQSCVSDRMSPTFRGGIWTYHVPLY